MTEATQTPSNAGRCVVTSLHVSTDDKFRYSGMASRASAARIAPLAVVLHQHTGCLRSNPTGLQVPKKCDPTNQSRFQEYCLDRTSSLLGRHLPVAKQNAFKMASPRYTTLSVTKHTVCAVSLLFWHEYGTVWYPRNFAEFSGFPSSVISGIYIKT